MRAHRGGMVVVPAVLALLALLAAGVAAGCGGDDDEPDASAFAGTWDVQLVVGAATADPAAVVVDRPGDTFRETWAFEDCDQGSCRLRRPEGGLVLGDLDDVPFTFEDLGSVDDTPRFRGVAEAAAVPRVDPQPPPGDEDDHAADDHDDDDHDEGGAEACAGSPAHRWDVTIEVDVRDGVLSGTVLRIPTELRSTVDGVECFGTDLTLGLSGIPAGGAGTAAG